MGKREEPWVGARRIFLGYGMLVGVVTVGLIFYWMNQ